MRLEKIKSIRKKLKNGKPSVGSWQQIPHSSISEILGKAGFDWVAVDMEHGSISTNQLPDLFRALELGSTLPLVRVASSKVQDCKLALDAGSGGIIAPMIETAEQLILIKEASCWPPIGSRGVGFSRANLFGKNFEEYKEEAYSPLLIAQIESVKAVNNLDQILQVEGLDAIMVGPYDLSASMGLTAKFDNQDFIDIINSILKTCIKYNIPCGDHIIDPDTELLKERISLGYRFIAYSVDAVFLNQSCLCPKID